MNLIWASADLGLQHKPKFANDHYKYTFSDKCFCGFGYNLNWVCDVAVHVHSADYTSITFLLFFRHEMMK